VYFSILAFYLRRLVFRRQLPKYVIRTGSLRTLRDSEPGPV
jgi:hypothetical protein